jgi:hypothetical protein
MSQSYNCRPSAFFGSLHPVTEFYVDRTVWRFGTSIDGEIENAAKSAKNDAMANAAMGQVITRWLGSGGGAKQKYRDPANLRK